MNRVLPILLILFAAFSVKAQTKVVDITNVDSVKYIMEGDWYRLIEKRDTIFEKFTFRKDEYSGSCYSKNYISTAPFFELVYEDSTMKIKWIDITGGGSEYKIVQMTNQRMIVACGR